MRLHLVVYHGMRQPKRVAAMGRLSTTVEQARFWRESAGQLRQLAQAPNEEKPLPERLLELADEYERLADKLVEDWAVGGQV